MNSKIARLALATIVIALVAYAMSQSARAHPSCHRHAGVVHCH